MGIFECRSNRPPESQFEPPFFLRLAGKLFQDCYCRGYGCGHKNGPQREQGQKVSAGLFPRGFNKLKHFPARRIVHIPRVLSQGLVRLSHLLSQGLIRLLHLLSQGLVRLLHLLSQGLVRLLHLLSQGLIRFSGLLTRGVIPPDYGIQAGVHVVEALNVGLLQRLQSSNPFFWRYHSDYCAGVSRRYTRAGAGL